jgi:zinc finger protein xfin
MELIDRIKRVNKERERINKESVEAQARKNVLEEQISELVGAYSQKYNISFPKISNLEEFGNFLEELLDKTATALENEVELAEEVNQLISEGRFEEAKEVLARQGVKIPEVPKEEEEEEVTSEEGSELEEQNEEDGNEEVIDEDNEVSESLDELKEDLEEDLVKKPKRPIRNVEPVEEEDEEEEEVPQERPKLRRSRRRVPQTSDFDMSISKEDLDEVAAVTPKKTQPLEELDDLDSESKEAEEEAPRVSKLIRRRPRVSTEESSASPVRRRRGSSSGLVSPDDLEDEDMPVGNPAPVKSGGSFSWDN